MAVKKNLYKGVKLKDPVNNIKLAKFIESNKGRMITARLFDSFKTRYDLSSIIITYPFYAKIKRARNKQYYPVLFGNNHEIVFTGETHKNHNDVVLLIKSWFPQIQVK